MSSPVHIDIDHLATLSRLALTPEEKAKFSAQLGDILGYVEQLKQVNVDGVEPTAHATPIFNVLQSDEPRPGLPVEDALRNAPAQRDHMVLVPRVVE
jgi:aspartyl-tRNA(Asn)/glutamyl-tRNA(Gln) amidotransferase subunit C